MIPAVECQVTVIIKNLFPAVGKAYIRHGTTGYDGAREPGYIKCFISLYGYPEHIALRPAIDGCRVALSRFIHRPVDLIKPFKPPDGVPQLREEGLGGAADRLVTLVIIDLVAWPLGRDPAAGCSGRNT